MDTKPPGSYLAHLAWIIPSVIALIGIALDHLDWASLLLSNIWQLFFVNIWYLWVVAAGYGLYRFVRLIQRFHNMTNNVLPTLMTADAENLVKTVKLVEKESASRVAAIDNLAKRIGGSDTQAHDHIKRGLTELQTKTSEQIKREAHERTEGISALQRYLDRQFERINDIETQLPRLVTKDIKELETKLVAQITALSKRVETAERPASLNMNAAKGLGLINSIPPAQTSDTDLPKGLLGLVDSVHPTPTPAELLADAVKKHRDKQ